MLYKSDILSKFFYLLFQKIRYPNGFFIVLVVNTDDSECSLGETIRERSKHVQVEITNSITTNDYVFASLSVLGMFTAFCAIYIVGSICCRVHHSRILRAQSLQDELDRAQQAAQSPDPQPSSGFQEVC